MTNRELFIRAYTQKVAEEGDDEGHPIAGTIGAAGMGLGGLAGADWLEEYLMNKKMKNKQLEALKAQPGYDAAKPGPVKTDAYTELMRAAPERAAAMEAAEAAKKVKPPMAAPAAKPPAEGFFGELAARQKIRPEVFRQTFGPTKGSWLAHAGTAGKLGAGALAAYLGWKMLNPSKRQEMA